MRLILEVLRYITFSRLKWRTRSHLVCRSPSKHDQSIIYGDRPCVRYFRMTQSRRWSFLQIWQSIAGRYLSLRTSIMSGNTRGHEWPYLTMSESGHKAIPSHVLTYLAPRPEYSRKKICQYHGWWWPGSLRRQAISSQSIDYAPIGKDLKYLRYLSISEIIGKCKYIFMFPQNVSTHKQFVC